jgi:hypothetical protein
MVSRGTSEDVSFSLSYLVKPDREPGKPKQNDEGKKRAACQGSIQEPFKPLHPATQTTVWCNHANLALTSPFTAYHKENGKQNRCC